MSDRTLAQSAAELKRRLNEVVQIALERFEQETGVTPSSITVRMVNATRRGDLVQRYVLGDVTIGLDL